MTILIRQGDVMLKSVDDLPSDLIAIPVDEAEGVVLARGELHGHRHMLPYGGALLYASVESGSRYVTVTNGPTVLQQLGEDNQPTGDHASLDVPEGKYEVIQQRQAEDEKAVYRDD